MCGAKAQQMAVCDATMTCPLALIPCLLTTRLFPPLPHSPPSPAQTAWTVQLFIDLLSMRVQSSREESSTLENFDDMEFDAGGAEVLEPVGTTAPVVTADKGFTRDLSPQVKLFSAS